MLEIERFKNFYKSDSIFKLKHHPEPKATETVSLNDVLIFVMDHSGSMSGTRLANLRVAVINLTQQIKNNFKHIHYIAFQSIAKEIAYDDVIGLLATGGTDFDKANEKMFECISKYPTGTVISVIYFTDGEGSINFQSLKRKLDEFQDKDIVFNTVGFSSESNKRLLIELTQSGSSLGTYKSINNVKDISFEEYAYLFRTSHRGHIELKDGTKRYFSLDVSNEETIFIENSNETDVQSCYLNNEEIKFKITDRSLEEFKQIEEFIKILESYFNLVLVKKAGSDIPKTDLLTMLKEFKIFLEIQYLNRLNTNVSIFEADSIDNGYDDLLQTVNSYIKEAQKSSSNFIELKSLTYNNITKNRFNKRLDDRAAKNELKFTNNLNKTKEFINSSIDEIDKLDPKDWEDVCYLTQLDYKDILKNFDCLGVCINMERSGEVVIVNPNFIKIHEIGYSSFVSLNSMFMALKYFYDRNKDEQEMLNLHGGFMKNLKSHFLEGTHRAQYNAMIPLFINDLHWKVARKLLEPLFGYLVTLNITGYAPDQYYTLYFLVFEKIILDMINDPKSDAIKRMYDQLKICCEKILEEFYILNPNATEFLDNRLKRTKDERPNLNSYLLYIYLNNDEHSYILNGNFDKFEYAYFEEQLRRYLGMEFDKTKQLNLFQFNELSIINSAAEFFDENDLDQLQEILKLSDKKLIDLVFNKTNIQLYNPDAMFNNKTVEKINNYFKSFSRHKIKILFDFVFKCESKFFEKHADKAVAIVYQLIEHGIENDKWRFYQNYKSFEDSNFHVEYLQNEYLRIVSEKFMSEYNKLGTKLMESRGRKMALEYLITENYNSYKFVCGDKSLVLISVLNQIESPPYEKNRDIIPRIFNMINNTYNSFSYSDKWRMAKKHLHRIFRVLYLTENKLEKLNFDSLDEDTIEGMIVFFNDPNFGRNDLEKLYNEDKPSIKLDLNDKRWVIRHPYSWLLLYNQRGLWNGKYLFVRYRFVIERQMTKIHNLGEYIDKDEFEKANKYDEYFGDSSRGKRMQYSKDAPVLDQKQKVQIYEDHPRTSTLSTPLVELEKKWIIEQQTLKLKHILTDTESWQTDLGSIDNKLKHIAVLDLISDKDDNSTCVAGMMIFEADHSLKILKLVEGLLLKTKLTEPYLSGLLAFREANAYQELIRKANIKPQLFLFDGNGLLHKREFGLASHIGVLEDTVTIGFAKKLHFVDNLPYKNLNEFRDYTKSYLINSSDSCEIKTVDNKILGYAYLSGVNSTDPVFISPGHKISSKTSLDVIKLIDSYLANMGKSTRESIIGYVDKMTRRLLNNPVTFEQKLSEYF